MVYKNTLKGNFIIVETKDKKRVYRLSCEFEKYKKRLKTDSKILKSIFFIIKFPATAVIKTYDCLFINGILKLIKFVIKKISKKLCKTFKISKNIINEEIFNPRYMRIKEIEDYINSHYVDQEYIEKANITNDLVIFKSYRDDLEIDADNDGIFPNLLSTMMTVFVAFLSLEIADKSHYLAEFSKLKEANLDVSMISEKLHHIDGVILAIVTVIIMISLFKVLFFALRIGKKSMTNRLKTVNNVIYILEAIKDEMVEENKISDADESKDCKGLNETSSDKPNVNRRKGKDKNKSSKKKRRK